MKAAGGSGPPGQCQPRDSQPHREAQGVRTNGGRTCPEHQITLALLPTPPACASSLEPWVNSVNGSQFSTPLPWAPPGSKPRRGVLFLLPRAPPHFTRPPRPIPFQSGQEDGLPSFPCPVTQPRTGPVPGHACQAPPHPHSLPVWPVSCLQTELPRQTPSLCMHVGPHTGQDLPTPEGFTVGSAPSPEISVTPLLKEDTNKGSLMAFYQVQPSRCLQSGPKRPCGLLFSSSPRGSLPSIQTRASPILQTCPTASRFPCGPSSIFLPDRTLAILHYPTQTFWLFPLEPQVILPPLCFQVTCCLSFSGSSCHILFHAIVILGIFHLFPNCKLLMGTDPVLCL